ncbi:MAG: PPC domain-containing DNA-binding protein [candidate division WOR-3 bacterium]
MRFRKNGPYYQLRLERSEEIVASLATFVRKSKLRSAFLVGLGAGENLVLGFYDLRRRRYQRRRFRGEYEITSLVGNVAWAGGEPVCHVHAVISNSRLTTFSGHLFEGHVTVTCEITVMTGVRRLERRLEPDSGLKLLHL